ncbi:MAG: protein kinase domain-containing protein [Chitinispirillaceae bacterium]
MLQYRENVSNPYQSQVSLPNGREPIPLGSGVVNSLLGQGGMASVYEIWNERLEVYRAVKLVHPNCGKEALNRFDTEIKITAKLHHPNIIEIHGVGSWNGLPFIEMEKIDGITQEKLILDRGAVPIPVAVSIGLMVSRALEYAHNHEYQIYNEHYNGIIHRDLKPGNIMICTDGVVKLMDFGIARPTDASFHTIDGTVVGTLQYLSPEQLEGKKLDVRTDIYSFGVCMYEMLTGHLAFPEPNLSRLLSDKAKNRFRPLEEYDLRIPAKLARTIEHCMQQDPNRRVSDATKLSSELTDILCRFTHDTPEKVVLKYLQNPDPKPHKVFVRTKKSRIAKKTMQISLLGIIGMLSAYLLFSFLSDMNLRKGNRDDQPAAGQQKIAKRKIETSDTEIDSEERSDEHAVSEKVSKPATESSESKPLKVKKRVNSTSAVRKKRAPGSEISTDASVSSAAPKPVSTRLFVETLKDKYATNDLLQILSAEVRNSNYESALKLYDSLPPQSAGSKRAVVLKSRALERMKKYSELNRFLNETDVQEAEVFIAKARAAIRQGRANQAKTYLEKASRTPAEFAGYEKISKDVFFYKAVCATMAFDAEPVEKNWKDALEAWYLVKREMRNESGHRFYRKAESEVARIGEKYRNLSE